MMGLRAFLVRLCLQRNKLSKWNRFSRGKWKPSHCAGVILTGKVKCGIETVSLLYVTKIKTFGGPTYESPMLISK